MKDDNKINAVEEIIQSLNDDNNLNSRQIKRLKSERGLIERTESSKIILAEDNRQVLID